MNEHTNQDLRRGRPRRSWQNPNSPHLFIALDVLDAALLSSKVGVSRPYDSGRGFREGQDEAIVQANRIGREVRDVKGRRERLRAVAERGGHKVRRLAKEHRDKLLQEQDVSGTTSASQVTVSVFDHNAGRAEQVLAAIGKGELLNDPVPGWRR